MRALKMTMWVSLDGYISGPDNDMGFVGKFYDDRMGRYQDGFVSGADTLILGRETYDSFAGAWPNVPDNPDVSEQERAYARKLNALRKIVYTTSLTEATWQNSDVRATIDADELRALKSADGQDIIIYGSGQIVRQLTDLGLIDEYQLLVHPVLLGGGKSLFRGIHAPVDLQLAASETFPSGVLLLTYHQAAV